MIMKLPPTETALPALEQEEATIIIKRTLSNDQESEHSKMLKRHRQDGPRTVRFCDSQQVCTYEPVDKDQHGHVWYTAEDVAMFRQQTRWLALHVQQEDQSWSCALETIYRAFRANDHPAEIEALLHSTDIVMNEYTVGLINFAIAAIAQDIGLLRQHLLSHVRHMQCTMPNATERAEMIGETSRLTSRASRLFTMYIAKLAAVAD